MNLQEIEVTITTDGQMKIKIKGVKGTKCHDIIKGLDDLVGRPTVDRETEEYRQAPALSKAARH